MPPPMTARSSVALLIMGRDDGTRPHAAEAAQAAWVSDL
jgi:hypothetical protein